MASKRGRGPDKGGRYRKTGSARLELYERAREAIEFLMERNGHTTLTKAEFADALADKYGRRWLTASGDPNRRLVEEVCNLTRDQDDDPTAKALFDGCVVFYAPSVGGMTLSDLSGEMLPDHLLHMLSGDLERQQAAKTINRRRITSWRAASHNAMRAGEHDLASLLAHIENEIDSTGFVSDTLVADFLKRVQLRRVA